MTDRVALDRPWLTWEFDRPQRVLSWAINNPGFVETTRILWREVRNADLPVDLDVRKWLQTELSERESQGAVAFLTSRDIRAFHDRTCVIENATARCIATTGLSNAERVGTRMDRSSTSWGTINIAVHTDIPLSDAARVEAISVAAQARTVAVMSAGLVLPTGLATGTGTDCVAIAAPAGDTSYAGLHTALGEAIGASVVQAVSAGAAEWMQHVRRKESL